MIKSKINLQKIKESRLSEPEKILLESFKGLKKYTCWKYTNVIFYVKDKTVLYYYQPDVEYFGYDFDLISSKIKPYFSTYMEEIRFVEKLIIKYLKVKFDVLEYWNFKQYNENFELFIPYNEM